MAHVCQRALGTRGKLFFVAVAHETSAVLAVYEVACTGVERVGK